MDVTRERVRQVESSFLKTFFSFVGDNYQKELSKYLKENKIVNNVFELEKVGESFKNISKLILMGTDSRRFLNNLFREDSQISWERNGIYYNFYESDKQSKETLVANVDFKTDLFFDMNFDEYISFYCVIHDREHLKKQISEEAKIRLLKKPGVIASYCAKRLLSLKPNGFTKEDVAEISKKELNHDIKSLRSAMHSLQDSRAPSGLQLMGNSGKFIWVSEYLPMSKEKKDYLLSLCINLLKENPGRMFLTSEIMKLVKKDNFFTSLEKEEKEKLTKDFLNAILKEHKDSLPVEIQDLGKSKWSFNSKFISGIDNKKTLSEIVEEILIKNGEPLSTFQLSKRVDEIRGVKNFQMHTTLSQRRILYVSPNVYGLRDRDIDLSDQKEDQFIIEILNSDFKLLRKFKFQDPSFTISTYDYDPRYAYMRGQAVSKDGSVIDDSDTDALWLYDTYNDEFIEKIFAARGSFIKENFFKISWILSRFSSDIVSWYSLFIELITIFIKLNIRSYFLLIKCDF